MEGPQASIRLTGNLDQINMRSNPQVAACPETGTSVRGKLPDTTHVQARNIRLLSRDTKAAVRRQISALLHLWKTMIL